MRTANHLAGWLARVALGLALVCVGPLRGAEVYQKAPAPIPALLDAPATPVVSLSPARDRMLLVQGVKLPPITELTGPAARLAGYRLNTLNNAPLRAARYSGFTLAALDGAPGKTIATPPGARFGFPVWSPDGKLFAVLKYNVSTVELWIGDAQTATLRRLRGVLVNAAPGDPVQWLPDGQSLVCHTIPANRGKAPMSLRAPAGPVIQESKGVAAPARTYQDLLEDAHDELAFDYYFTAQLMRVNARTGAAAPVGKPGIFSVVEPSPDGAHLLVSRLHRPYSYLLPASFFPREVEVWDFTGKVEFKLASIPLADDLPPGAVMPGPRRYHWRPTAPATLVWVEALDGGDPKRKVPHRDKIVMHEAPFRGSPEELIRTQHRFSAISWGEKSWVALVKEYQSSKRWNRTFLVNPDAPAGAPRLLWDLSAQDRYNDPGAPMMRTLATGQRAMRVNGNYLYLNGSGASAEGDRPFLDRLNLETFQTERLFQSDEHSYESVIAFVSTEAAQVITRHESPTNPPNYFLRSLKDGARRALTRFPDPAPQLRGLTRQLITYPRDDGVPLSATLFLPPDHRPGQRLPTIVWAYPREYNDADTAGQVAGSANRFTTPFAASHLFLLTQGYAILDGATMPVVGDVKTANDTFLEQITASARAAIDKAVELGVTDPQRVGVAGHSYGAFMTVNLLAHSDLFRAGVARSGAYNRTLTPFGFQSERRSLWEAQDMYLKISPFLAADKIKEPLLLIHGEDDNNPGTFTLQSERMFQAIRGNGGIARLVLLPGESHSYDARESVEHVLAEMIAWFDKYVKHAPPRAPEHPPGR
ncbi:MAG: S9 family peptidase [Verrucomicrobia bacterium]|nr:S9 family peptidase [Verrucomicrobiota bacterium]